MASQFDAARLPRSCEVAVVGGGIVGTAVAERLASSGVEVCLLERSGLAAGASSAGEGDLLVSDKLPGPELEISLRSLQLWHELAERAGAYIELEEKGGLVVAQSHAEMEGLSSLAQLHKAQGVEVDLLGPAGLREVEGALSPRLAGGAYYPTDCQVQPMRAVEFQAGELVRKGGKLALGTEVLGVGRRRPSGEIAELETSAGTVAVDRCVVNAAGAWAGELSRRLGDEVPVRPRKGHVLVTEPLAPFLRHKVYEATYMGSVHAGDELSCAAVVESTPAGTVLIGSSRQSVGFAGEVDYRVVQELARRAIAVVPGLAGARIMRVYSGFRPATPDRLAVIGPSGAVPNLFHATGHEGAGILLSQVTAELVADLVLGREPALDWTPFSPARFAGPGVVAAAGGEAPTGASLVDSAGPTGAGYASPPEAARVATLAGEKTGELLRFYFDRRLMAAPAGSTVAGALMFNGVRAWRTTRGLGAPRGVFCGIGTCFDCLVDLNGRRAVRACLALLQDGDQVCSSGSVGEALGG